MSSPSFSFNFNLNRNQCKQYFQCSAELNGIETWELTKPFGRSVLERKLTVLSKIVAAN